MNWHISVSKITEEALSQYNQILYKNKKTKGRHRLALYELSGAYTHLSIDPNPTDGIELTA